jgi:hypothetical protein
MNGTLKMIRLLIVILAMLPGCKFGPVDEGNDNVGGKYAHHHNNGTAAQVGTLHKRIDDLLVKILALEEEIRNEREELECMMSRAD